jgi:lipopolysaccharide/colanic/teichoic acid biosynthesis glycosyltransferase
MHLEMPEPAEDFVPPAATPFAALTMETCRGFFEGPGIPLWKRGLDIVFALVGMLLVSPLILLSTIAVKMLSPGPAFFGQERVGLMGKRFKCWKIRTMHADIDHEIHRQYFHNLMCHDVPMHKLDQRQDPRLIPLIGRFLRASAIDELPQLVNVLRGEMSLVGPRPCLPYEYEEYLQWQKQRVEAVPGLTGLWQVSGKNRTTFTQMMRLDISYSRRKSLWTDSRILIRTLPAVWNEIRRALGPRQQR